MRSILNICVVLIAALSFTMCSSTKSMKVYSEDEKKEIDMGFKPLSPDSLKHYIALREAADTGYLSYPTVSAYRHLGRAYRNRALFKEAIEAHKTGLELAKAISDTLEIIQAYNNLGTDYRRMGILEESSDYHYMALDYCEKYSDTSSFTIRKNKVVTLNGIGNIYLTLGNLEVAEDAFREALKGETSLNSHLGQAINYANIGAIMELKGQNDSALVYYKESLQHNELANSKLGIALCYNHFGELAEKAGNFEEGYRNYKQAYEIMEKSNDRWHWLECCVHYAKANLARGSLSEAERCLREGKKVAESIRSFEHLNLIYGLISQYYEQKGQLKLAFDNYKLSIQYGDSLSIEENTNHIQNLRVAYEKERSNAEIEIARKAFENEEQKKHMLIWFIVLLILSSGVVIVLLIYAQHLRAKKNAVLKKTAMIQQTFFTNITHEFRTPLTVILGIAKETEKETDDEDLEQRMHTIIRHGNNLLHLVNQLLDIAKIKSSIGVPDWHQGDVIALARMMTENIAAYADTKDININFVSELPEIEMDFVPDYMMKVFRNLLDNAVKYTPNTGNVYFSIKLKNDKVIMNITDDGNGIPKDKLPHIFDFFYQAGDKGTGNIGSGVGLSMVKQMIQTMNGKITVNSVEGKGTDFCIEMPQQQGNSSFDKWLPEDLSDDSQFLTQDKIEIESLDHEGGGLIDILVVEDNVDVARYIGSILKDKYSITYAANGEIGLAKAIELVPDIILSDIMMPVMDGITMFQEIRKNDITNHIPIIAITAKSEDRDRLEILDAGADTYLLKPFNSEELCIRIKNMIDRREALKLKATDEEESPHSQLPEASRKFLTNLNEKIYANLSKSSFSSVELADLMCMSRSQLNRKIKSITQFDTTSYIRDAKITLAKKLLLTSDMNIGEIMDECGFEYRSYFNKVFKQSCGTTPAQFRAQNLGK